MKKWLKITFGVISVIVILLVLSIYILINKGYGISVGRYLEAKGGEAMLIRKNSPISMHNRTNYDLVSDLDTFKEFLIKSLIRNGIEYVNIDNEFHFMDKIYRFYDVKLLSKLIDEGIVIFGKEDEMVRILSAESLMFARDKADIENAFIGFEPEVEEVTFKKKGSSIPKYNKSMIKRQNYMLNQKLKNNRR